MLGNLVKSIARGLAALAMLAVGGVILLLAVLWWEHKTRITLPEPTGHFAVGRTTYTWVNDTQADELAVSTISRSSICPSVVGVPATGDSLRASFFAFLQAGETNQSSGVPTRVSGSSA